MARRGVELFVAATAILALAAYITIYARGWAEAPIRSDGFSFYVYLPSVVIYHDPSLEALAADWYGGRYPDFSAIRRVPATGRWLDAVPIGEAILIAPFFLTAHALSWWSNLPRDGFSFYYQHGAGLAGLTYVLLGLVLVRRLLRRHFSDGVVLATLVVMTWGTNLFHYGTYDATFSHAFSFFLVAAWLALVDAWWERASTPRSIGLAVTAALIVLVRNVNAVFLLLLPLYGGWRLGDLWPRRAPLAVAAGIGALCLVPQAVLLKAATGSWAANSYALLNNRFSFSSPRILPVLFSTQKGLFFWSPALLLAFVGAFAAIGWARRLVMPVAIIFALQTYIVASWGDWQLGGSFGHRAFTDGLALVAPLIASALAWASVTPTRRLLVGGFAIVTVALSVAQMIQYWLGILPIIDTTWDQYRALFLRF